MSRQQLDALPGLVEEATQRVAALAASRGDTDAQRCRVLATDIVHVLITYKAIRVALGALRSGSAPEPDAAGLTIPQQVSFLHTKAAQLQTALVGLLGEVHGRSAIPPTGSLLPGLLTSATFPNILTGAVGNAAETPRGLLPSSTAHSGQQGADLRKPEDITDFLVASLSSLQTAPTRPAPSGAGQQAGLQAPPPLALPHMLPHREAKVGTASRDGTVWVLSCQARRVAIRRAERAWQRAQDAAAAALEKTARGQDRPVPPHACLSCWKRKKRCDHRRPCASCVERGWVCEDNPSVVRRFKRTGSKAGPVKQAPLTQQVPSAPGVEEQPTPAPTPLPPPEASVSGMEALLAAAEEAAAAGEEGQEGAVDVSHLL